MFSRILRCLFPPAAPATLSSLDAYQRWAAAYPPHAHNALMQAEEAAMRALFPPMAGKVVLDLACGTGRYGLLAGAAGAQTVIGLDNSAAMLHQNALPLLALATSEAIPLAGESVDVVLCGLALGHLPHLLPSIAEISRVLKPGGYALISDFHPFIFLNGQRRTFTAPDGKTYAVEHYAHLYADFHAAGRDAGLQVEEVLEPRLGQDAEVRFAGERLPGTPVIIAYRLRK
ncbi:MAG: methyltransferase domain-containing protein [Anaerolineaceae bacterium]|nr:methyltransferase domain-containing protein [Anaerolineaceae bacterium]